MSKINKKREKKEKKKKRYENWEVERIVDKRTTSDGEDQYLVEWKNWEPGDYKWLPKSHLHCARLLREFEKSLLATPKITKSARKPPTSSIRSKITKNPAASTPRRRSARINKKLVDEEEQEEDDASAVEAVASSSKRIEKKRNRHVSSSSSEDEAPPTKTTKPTSGDSGSSYITRVLRKRPQLSPRYTSKRRSAPAKVEASPTKKNEKKNTDSPSSDASATLFGSTPARVIRRRRPRSTGPQKSATKNLVSEMRTRSKAAKETKRGVVESEEDEVHMGTVENKETEENVVAIEDNGMDLDLDLELNNGEQIARPQDAHIEPVIKQEVVDPEPEVVPNNDNITNNKSYGNSEVKVEEVDPDSTAVDESILPKDVASEEIAPKTIEQQQQELSDVLESIADEGERLSKDSNPPEVTGYLSKESNVGDKEASEMALAIQGLFVRRPPSRLPPSEEPPSSDAETDEGSSMDRIYEECAGTDVRALIDELVNKVNLCSDKNTTIIGAEKKGQVVRYKLMSPAGETIFVNSDEMLKNMNEKKIKFWESCFISNRDNSV